MASRAPDDQTEKPRGEQEADQTNPEAHREIHHRIAQQVPDPGPCPRPDEGADHPVADEPGDAQCRRAGQAGRDGVQLGQEPGGDLELRRPSQKPVLSPTDERLGIGREPTEDREHSRAAPPTYAVPAEIRAQASSDRDRDGLDNAHPAGRRQRPRREENRNDRQRHTALIGKNPAEQHPLEMAEAHRGHRAVVTGRRPLRVPGAPLSSKRATSKAVGPQPDAPIRPTDRTGTGAMVSWMSQ